MSLNAKDDDSKMAFRPTETGAEILALVQTAAQRESLPSPFVFVSERGTPFTTAGFARMIERVAAGGGLEAEGASRLRLCARQQGARYQGNPRMARQSVDHEHGRLYGPGTKPVKDFWRE